MRFLVGVVWSLLLLPWLSMWFGGALITVLSLLWSDYGVGRNQDGAVVSAFW